MDKFFYKTADLGGDSEKGITAVLSEYEIKDSAGDIIRTGAFDEFLAEKAEIPALLSHEKAVCIGSWTKFRMEGAKLMANLEIDRELSAGKDAMVNISKGRYKEVSIGFVVRSADDYSVEKREDGEYGIDFRKIDIFETSVVLRGAHPSAVLLEGRDEIIKEHDSAIKESKRQEALKEREKEDKQFWNELGSRLNSIIAK